MRLLKSLALSLPLLAASALAADPAEPAEVTALRKELERRRADALRPVQSWYEGELTRLERSFTTRGNLDAALAVRKEREIAHVEQAQISRAAMKELLDDSRWRWNGTNPEDIRLRRDGVLECETWNRQGYTVKWQVTGPLSVTYTIVKGPADVGKSVVLYLSPDLKSFEGKSTDGTPIKPSPRLK